MHFNHTVLWISGPLAGTVTVEQQKSCADRLTLSGVAEFLEFMGVVGSTWTRMDTGRYTVLAAVPVWADLLPE